MHFSIIKTTVTIFFFNKKENFFLDTQKLTPFGRAGIHAAIAYYIYVNKNRDQDFRNVDPTSAARALREKKFVIFLDFFFFFM